MRRRRATLLKSFAIILCTLFLTGCVSTKDLGKIVETNAGNPLSVHAYDFPTVEFEKLVIDMPEDKVVGAYHVGLLKIKRSVYTAGVKFREDAGIKEILTRELAEAGYSVIGGTVLFEDAKEEKESRILIGGAVTDYTLNAYDSVGGASSESNYVIRWQVYDKKSKSVIYKAVTTGHAKMSGIGSHHNASSIKAAFRTFLEDPKLVDALKALS